VLKPKRENHSLDRKEEVIRWHINNKTTQAETAARFGIDQGCISRWLKKKTSIHITSKLGNGSVKRLRTSKHPDLEQALFHWILEAHAHKLIITADVLRTKAAHFGGLLGITSKYSTSWINKFKRRYNIFNFQMHGEAGAVDPVDAESARKKMVELTKGFEPCDIYNADETGLLWW
jgi:L-arabinose isomerase